MALANPVISNFTAGEISDRLFGRIDVAKYFNAASIIENMIVLKGGGVTKRPPLRFVHGCEDNANRSRVIPFQFNVEQAYVVELGDQIARFYLPGGSWVLENFDISAATQANPCAITTSANHSFSTGDVVSIAGVVGMTELNGNSYTITVTGPTTFTLDGIDSSAYAAYVSGGVVTGPDPYTIAAPWASAELADIQFAQSADVMYIVHRSHKPRTLTRTSATRFSVANFAPTADPFTSTNNYPGAVTIHDQRLHFFGTNAEPQSWWASVLGTFGDLTVGTGPTAGFKRTLADTNAIQWATYGEDLLVGTLGGETRIFPSSAENISADDANVRNTTTYGSERIQPERVDSATFFIQRHGKRIRELFQSIEGPYVADDMLLLADHLTGYQSVTTRLALQRLAWHSEPWSVLWAQRADGVLLGMTYDKRQQVAGWHRHITDGYVESACVVDGSGGQELWVVVRRNINGSDVRYIEYLDSTFDFELRQEDGGFADSMLTLNNPITMTGATKADPVVITAASHGLSNGDQVRITQVVGMTNLNGRVYTVANANTNDFELTDDDGNDIDGTGFTAYISGGEVRELVGTVSGLEHLEGETVAVMGDGSVQPSQVVASGSITLDSRASHVHVGLPFTARLRTVPLAVPGAASVGAYKSWGDIAVMVHGTGTCRINDNEVDFRRVEDAMDAPVPLRSMTVHVSGGDTDEDAFVDIISSAPIPLTVLHISGTAEVNRP